MMKHSSATAGSYNFIDLFAGAGGLSEGFIQAGFSPVAHVEMNAFAAQTLETRTGYYCLKEKGQLDVYRNYIQGKISRDEFLSAVPKDQLDSVLCETMSDETLPGLFAKIDNILKQRGIEKVDVIIGGPPCQAEGEEHRTEEGAEVAHTKAEQEISQKQQSAEQQSERKTAPKVLFKFVPELLP